MAYDNGKVRELRRDVNVLNGAEAELRRRGHEPEPSQGRGRGCQRERGSIRIGPVPHEVDVRLKSLAARGMVVAGNERELLLGEVKRLRKGKLGELTKELQRMRWQRAKRWKDALPKIWREAPGRIFAWLRGERTAWGQVPLLGADGEQLTTIENVDRAVQGFWVEKVWCKERPEEAQASWEALLSSEFAAHIPNVGREWPEPEWTADSVKVILQAMKKSAAPGMTGVPIGVWVALPEEWHEAVARLLNFVMETGNWPDEATEAYVALIPKGAGTEVSAQRPITVLELLFRVFAKGVVGAWRSVLQQEHLGEQAMGFRVGCGTRHLAQLLSDVVAMRRRQGKAIWLVSFDVKKCYDSIPWWALFGVLERSGVSRRVRRAFERFYEKLRRRFRYGMVDGEPWKGTNGMAQGCPAAPDMLNILFEPFQRWAAAQGRGVVLVGGGEVSSGSFADCGSGGGVEGGCGVFDCGILEVVRAVAFVGDGGEDPGMVQQGTEGGSCACGGGDGGAVRSV